MTEDYTRIMVKLNPFTDSLLYVLRLYILMCLNVLRLYILYRVCGYVLRGMNTGDGGETTVIDMVGSSRLISLTYPEKVFPNLF